MYVMLLVQCLCSTMNYGINIFNSNTALGESNDACRSCIISISMNAEGDNWHNYYTKIITI